MALVKDIKVPANLVPLFESILMRERIAVGVSYHDDGSRTYSFPNSGINDKDLNRYSEEVIEEFKQLYQ